MRLNCCCEVERVCAELERGRFRLSEHRVDRGVDLVAVISAALRSSPVVLWPAMAATKRSAPECPDRHVAQGRMQIADLCPAVGQIPEAIRSALMDSAGLAVITRAPQ